MSLFPGTSEGKYVVRIRHISAPIGEIRSDSALIGPLCLRCILSVSKRNRTPPMMASHREWICWQEFNFVRHTARIFLLDQLRTPCLRAIMWLETYWSHNQAAGAKVGCELLHATMAGGGGRRAPIKRFNINRPLRSGACLRLNTLFRFTQNKPCWCSTA